MIRCQTVSSRWKNKRASRQQMDMQMKYRLAAIGICVDHNAIPIFRKTLIASDIRGRREQMAELAPMPGAGLIQRINMLARNDQNMGRSLRRQIVKGNASIVLKD